MKKRKLYYHHKRKKMKIIQHPQQRQQEKLENQETFKEDCLYRAYLYRILKAHNSKSKAWKIPFVDNIKIHKIMEISRFRNGEYSQGWKIGNSHGRTEFPTVRYLVYKNKKDESKSNRIMTSECIDAFLISCSRSILFTRGPGKDISKLIRTFLCDQFIHKNKY